MHGLVGHERGNGGVENEVGTDLLDIVFEQGEGGMESLDIIQSVIAAGFLLEFREQDQIGFGFEISVSLCRLLDKLYEILLDLPDLHYK